VRRGLAPSLLAVSLAALSCASASGARSTGAPAALHVRYTVRFVPQPLALEVDLAFSGPARPFMFTRPGEVARVLVRTPRGERRLEVGADGRLALPADAVGLSYRYDTRRLTLHRVADLYTGAGGPEGFLLAGRSYLLRPRLADGVSAELRVEGADALLPWPAGPDGVWRLSGGALVDSGFHAFNGRRCVREVGGTRVEVALLGAPVKLSDDFLCDWVARSAKEAQTIRRPLPYPRLTVHLVPAASAEASVLGLLLWSEPPSLALTVGTHADEAAFARDWVALHELIHVLHPSFPGGPPWLSEGLSTYFTEVARMRSGRHTPAEGWRLLAEGFARGRAQAGDAALEEVVEGLRHGMYLPVYWAGALLCLELDLELRRATGGRSALEDVLERLVREGSTSTVQRFGEVVDELAGVPVFERVRARHAQGPALGRAPQILAYLGVQGEGDEVRLVDAPGAELRRAIGAD
jgi:hypothetical protein